MHFNSLHNFGMALVQKDAERHLPGLTNSVGIPLLLEDYQTGRYWAVRYRYVFQGMCMNFLINFNTCSNL